MDARTDAWLVKLRPPAITRLPLAISIFEDALRSTSRERQRGVGASRAATCDFTTVFLSQTAGQGKD